MIEEKLSSSKIISEAHLAISVPDKFIEKPTSALVNAGASFVPSPVTATTSFVFYRPVTNIYLSSGDERASTRRYFFISLNFFIFSITSIFFFFYELPFSTS